MASAPTNLPWYGAFLCAGLGACTAEVRVAAHHGPYCVHYFLRRGRWGPGRLDDEEGPA
jgi:hypothetical protein